MHCLRAGSDVICERGAKLFASESRQNALFASEAGQNAPLVPRFGTLVAHFISASCPAKRVLSLSVVRPPLCCSPAGRSFARR